MKIDYITLSILVLILLISCSMIIFQINKNSIKNDISKYKNELLKFVEPEIQENFIDINIEHAFTPASYEDKLQISKVSVLTRESDDNPFNNRIIYIEGSKLNRIVDVFFGDIKGRILQTNNILSYPASPSPSASDSQNSNSDIKKYISPPDFAKYGSNSSIDNLKNIAIKFLNRHDIIVAQPSDNSITEYDGNFNLTNNNEVEMDFDVNQQLKTQYSNKNLRIKKIISFQKNDNNKNNTNKFNLAFNDLGSESIYKVDFNNEEEVSLTFICHIKNFNLPKLKFRKINNNDSLEFQINNVKIDYIFDDINTLYPTGLFYRLTNNITAGSSLTELDFNSWNVFLGDRLSEEECAKLPTEVKNFYESVRQSISSRITTNTQTKGNEINYKVSNLNVQIDNNDKSQIKISWDIPESITDHNFTFLLDFEPTHADDKFKILNEKIAFDKDSYMFSNKKLIPTNTYKISVKTLKYKPIQKIMGTIEKTFKYMPDNIEAYHSHLFKNGKFDLTMTQSNPELVKTYYQLTEYNKGRTRDELIDTHEKIEDNSKCIKGFIDNAKGSKLETTFSNSFVNNLNNDNEKENTNFEKTQEEQEDKIQKITNKLAKN